eukprot:876194-Prymnesium_polylepis.1
MEVCIPAASPARPTSSPHPSTVHSPPETPPALGDVIAVSLRSQVSSAAITPARVRRGASIFTLRSRRTDNLCTDRGLLAPHFPTPASP